MSALTEKCRHFGLTRPATMTRDELPVLLRFEDAVEIANLRPVQQVG